MLGADALRTASPRWFRRALVWCGVLAVACVVTFTNDRFIARGWLDLASTRSAPWQNLYGIVYYAGGDVARAHELFDESAAAGWFLADENLGYLMLRDGRPLEALYHVRLAARRQPLFSFGTKEDRATFDRLNQADFQNQMAVIHYAMGDLDSALAAAQKAYELDDAVPEIRYDLAVVKLARAFARDDADDGRVRAIAQSRMLLLGAAGLDPAFFEVSALGGTLDVLEGNCARGAATIRAALGPHPHQYRVYPTTTGPGNVHAASLRRRTYITTLPPAFDPETQLGRCAQQAARD
jgi:tetratricopeptide (TPR) repeat protein